MEWNHTELYKPTDSTCVIILDFLIWFIKHPEIPYFGPTVI